MMPYDPDRHHRRSIRLPDYDYRQPGGYFVTIRVQDDACVFGEVRNGWMCVNACGRVAHACWEEIPAHFPQVQVDAFVVMPNHAHGIVAIIGEGATGVGATHASPLRADERPRGPQPKSLGAIIGSYKSAVTRLVRRDVRPDFRWQRNYYEHVIRGRRDLRRIRRYIAENPTRWELDRYYPDAFS